MSYDGMFTHAMVNELKDMLLLGRVTKIHQPYKNELVLVIRANRKNKKLLLSAHPQHARVQITEMDYENPAIPPQFCMVMRKYLDGAHLEKIEQVENDRIIHFHFNHRNELGDIDQLTLIAEIMGRHSNIILINPEDKKILETIRHVPSTMNSYRSLVPGAIYLPPPPQHSINPFDSFDEEKTDVNHQEKLMNVKDIQALYQGIGRDTAEELLYYMEAYELSIRGALKKYIDRLDDSLSLPTLTICTKKRESFTPFEYESLNGYKEPYQRLSELVDRYYEKKAEKDRAHQQAADLIRLVRNLLEKNDTKLSKLEKEFYETEEKETFRIKGEVLTAFMHQVEVGKKEVVLPNFYDGNNSITIQLDPRKSPAENAQQYFKKYNKLKNAAVHLTSQIKHTKEEINYLETVQTQLDMSSPQDVDSIREELIQEGYLKKRQKKKQMSKPKKNEPDKYLSSDGTLLLVGKNNLQNDVLSMKTARKSDYWLHTKDIPGSHVIIRDSEPSEQTFLEAAHLAAYFSKSRDSASVPVDTVEVKKLKKPNGAKPGFLIYEGQTTLFVTPDEEVVRELKQNYNQLKA